MDVNAIGKRFMYNLYGYIVYTFNGTAILIPIGKQNIGKGKLKRFPNSAIIDTD